MAVPGTLRGAGKLREESYPGGIPARAVDSQRHSQRHSRRLHCAAIMPSGQCSDLRTSFPDP